MSSSFITVSKAAEMAASYRSQRESMLDSSYQNNITLPICETFDKSQVQTILNQNDCASFRVYPGMDENNRVVLMLVGVNSNDEDILGDSYVLERGIRCPEECPPKSALNDNE